MSLHTNVCKYKRSRWVFITSDGVGEGGNEVAFSNKYYIKLQVSVLMESF